MKKINVIIVFLLILMMLSPIIAWGVDAQISDENIIIVVESPGTILSGDTFDVKLFMGTNGKGVSGYQVEFVYNPRVITLVNINEGPFLIGRDRNPTIFIGDNNSGLISLVGAIIEPGIEVTTSGVFAILTFESNDQSGVSNLDLFNCIVSGVEAIPYSIEILNSTIEVIHNEYENPDVDEDGIPNVVDNCPLVSNPRQTDNDRDGMGNECDSCPNDPMNDSDGDGICLDEDNCPATFNPDQLDLDNDGLGDMCDRINDDNPRFSSSLIKNDSVITTVLDELGSRTDTKEKEIKDKVTFIWGGYRIKVEIDDDGDISILGVENEK